MELGWLSPDGELIPCNYLEHIIVADRICEKYYNTYIESLPDEFLMNHGWVHLTETRFMEYSYHILHTKHFTNAQKIYLKPIIIDDWKWINKWEKDDLIIDLDLPFDKDKEWWREDEYV